MREISLTEMRLMTVPKIKEGESFALTADGEFLGFLIVPMTSYIREHVLELAILSNAILPKE